MAARDIANVEVTGSNPVVCTESTKQKFIKCYNMYKILERNTTFNIRQGDTRYEKFDERRDYRKSIKIIKKFIKHIKF